jgi:hypothetical protein
MWYSAKGMGKKSWWVKTQHNCYVYSHGRDGDVGGYVKWISEFNDS